MRRRVATRSAAPETAGGYTLLELVTVVALLGILAAVAVPSMRPAEGAQMNLAAGWVVDTLAFARAEALRTGTPVYVEIDRDTDRLRVATANLTGSTVTAGATLRHPVTKQLLDVDLRAARATAGIDVTTVPFDYPSGGRQASVVFSAQGFPFRKTSGASQRMTLGEIVLVRGGERRTVRVAAVTGRVTVQ